MRYKVITEKQEEQAIALETELYNALQYAQAAEYQNFLKMEISDEVRERVELEQRNLQRRASMKRHIYVGIVIFFLLLFGSVTVYAATKGYFSYVEWHENSITFHYIVDEEP